MKNKFIIAGHNVLSPGAIAWNGKTEHIYNAGLQVRVIDKVTNYISMTGSSMCPVTDDDEKSLGQVINFINGKASKGSIGCDIHFNFDHPTASGTEIFIHPNTSIENKRRAIFIVNEISGVLGIPLRRFVNSRDYKYPSESPRGRLAILEDTFIPMTLPEIVFLSQHDLEKYKGREDDIALILKKAYFSYSFSTQIPVRKPYRTIIGNLDPKTERRI